VVVSSTNPRVVVVDTASGTTLAMLHYSSKQQDALSLNADGARLLANGNQTVYDVDPNSATFGAVVATIPTDGYPTR
jgi:hypothetical protein